MKRLHLAPGLPYLPIIACFILVQTVSAKPPDAAELHAKFTVAAGDHLEIVSHEIRPGPVWGSGIYWVAHVRARHTGIFKINYSYLYEHTALLARGARVPLNIRATRLPPRGDWAQPVWKILSGRHRDPALYH